MYRVHTGTGVNKKKSTTNNRTKKKRTALTNPKFYTNIVANGMSGEKNNCPAFGKTCSICKRKNHHRRCADTKKMLKKLKTRKWIEEGGEIFTLNTPTKNKVKVKNKWEILLHASRYRL